MTTITDLTSFLETMVQMRKSFELPIHKESWRFIMPEELILEQGTTWKAQPANPHDVYAEPQQCFLNCFLGVSNDPVYEYAEGYAMTRWGMAVHHAWLVDSETNEVHDPTWSLPEIALGRTDILEYRGIQFETDFILEESSKSGFPCQLVPNDRLNTDAMKHGYLIKDGAARGYAVKARSAS